ncbi:hypothetical protein D3C72_1955450 [compost metagenome]
MTLVISSHILAELQQRVDALAMLSNGRVCAQGTVQALRERSRMPLVFQLRAAPTWLQTLSNDLPGQLAGADVALQQREPDLLELRCPREHKMRVLAWLAGAGLSDLQIHEPSLEDVYFGLREAP